MPDANDKIATGERDHPLAKFVDVIQVFRYRLHVTAKDGKSR